MSTGEQFQLIATDGATLAAYRWGNPATASAAVQIAHGMGEHAQRYEHFASTLAAHGYVVYAQDHRGHGNSVTSDADLGKIGADGWPALVADIGALTDVVNREAPRLPVILFGHSMGSFALQQYLVDHSLRAAAAVLTGTAAIDLLEPALDLDQELDLAMFNAAFVPARTDYDWLSRDEVQVDAYIADPHCGFGLDTPAVKAMFAGARRLADPAEVALMHDALPVYIAVGESDPINGQMALVHALAERYRAAGLINVTVQSWPGARHEVLNETNRDDVEKELLSWIAGVLDSSLLAGRTFAGPGRLRAIVGRTKVQWSDRIRF